GPNSGLDPTMLKVFFYCAGVMTLLMIFLVRQRYKLERLRHQTEELRLAVEEHMDARTTGAGNS
ncbi:MAG: hypothetical protein ACYDD2_17170, partial [Candidatus Acidiferrales bacterium]